MKYRASPWLFLIVFVVALLVFPTPHFYKSGVCFGPAGAEECTYSTNMGLFYGAHYVYQNWTHGEPWDYFEYYSMSPWYLILWFIINALISIGAVTLYAKYKK